MAATVLITGASQGIGKATSLKFAKHGYNVVLVARQPDRLEATAQEVRSLGQDALAIPTDVRDPEQVKQLVQRAIEHFGAIDVLVNNAGIYSSGAVEEFSLDDWHQMIDTNLWGYIHLIHALLPHMLERKKGTIVNLSSIGGKVATPYLTPYCTTKFAVTGLTQALQAELSPKGVQVCGIYPNLIRSNFMERAFFRGKDEQDTQARRKQLEQVLNTPVIEKPEDVADAVWEAVKHRHNEVLVGSAKVSSGLNALFPGFVQWLSRKVFQNKDQQAYES